jgi:tetratricopeptide (TPR) repeat protein
MSFPFPLLPLGLVALLGLPAVRDDARTVYKELLAAWRKQDYERSLALAGEFLPRHGDYRHAAGATYIGADSAHRLARWDRAIALWRRLLADHPGYKKIPEGRRRLVQALLRARRLEEAVARCDRFLAAHPGAAAAPRWRYARGTALFRLWRFAAAEKQLEAVRRLHPGTPQARQARFWLGRIEPDLPLAGDLLVDDYAGKYARDPRFTALRERTPALVEESLERLRRELGVRGEPGALVRFADSGYRDRGGLRGKTYTICREGRPRSVILFYTEYMVLDPEGYGQRLCHELKHALFRRRMGQAYLELPRWVREGLALRAAGQLAERAGLILGNEVFAGRDPAAVLDGLADGDHTYTDYLEDALAFQWLEGQRRGAVRRFCRRLAGGAPWEEAFRAAAGRGEGWRRALDRHARKWVAAFVGEAGRAFIALRREDLARKRKDRAAYLEWAREKGRAAYARWLAAHPDHFLRPNAAYRLGRMETTLGEYAAAREAFHRVLAVPHRRHTLADDACWRLGRAWRLAGDGEEAARVFGILLRDYSWSRQARRLRDRYEPAPPLAPPDGK